jgi:hypothetical protein
MVEVEQLADMRLPKKIVARIFDLKSMTGNPRQCRI